MILLFFQSFLCAKPELTNQYIICNENVSKIRFDRSKNRGFWFRESYIMKMDSVLMFSLSSQFFDLSQIEAVQWRQQREKIIRSERFHNAPCFSETGLSLCTPGWWTSYHLYFCFQKLLTQSPHICHADHSLAKTPKHLAQNVNIQFVRNWVNISERKKFWPIYLDIAPITNKDAPLAQTQLASSLSRKMSNCQWWNNDHQWSSKQEKSRFPTKIHRGFCKNVAKSFSKKYLRSSRFHPILFD